MKARYAHNAPTEVKNITLSHPSITQVMVDSHCEILWDENSRVGLVRYPTETYVSGLEDANKQAVITQQSLMSKMLGLWIKNYLTTDYKRKLRNFTYEYTLNTQDDWS